MDVFRASNQKNYMKSSEMLSKSQISRFPGAGHPLPKGKTKKKKEVQKRGLRRTRGLNDLARRIGEVPGVFSPGVVRQSPTQNARKNLRFI